jgi:hypothetical protein
MSAADFASIALGLAALAITGAVGLAAVIQADDWRERRKRRREADGPVAP